MLAPAQRPVGAAAPRGVRAAPPLRDAGGRAAVRARRQGARRALSGRAGEAGGVAGCVNMAGASDV